MAQIEEYSPQVAAPEGLGGVSPNTNFAGAVGAGLKEFGSDVSEAIQIIHKKDVLQENADIYSHFADQRAFWTAKVQQQTQDGTLNIDKLSEDFQNSSDDFGSNISTREGKAYFERQQSRLKGSLLQSASYGMAQVAAADAKAKWQDGINKNASAIQADPLLFSDVYHQSIESVDELVKHGGLPEKMRGKAEMQMAGEFSIAALRGYIDEDPAKAEHMKPEFDKFMTPEQQHQMKNEIDQGFRAQEVEGRRAEKAVDDAQKLRQEKWGQDNLEKLQANALSSRDVLGAVRNGTLKWETGERWLKMIDEGAKQDIKTNPAVKNNLIQRIVNPESDNPITSQEDLMPYVGKGLSVTDFNQLNSLFKHTPEQEAMAQGQKALFDSAKKTIRFKNMITNQYDVMGEQKLAKFMSDYIAAKNQIKANGGNQADLTDPNSPLYFGSRLQDYQTSFQEQGANQMQAQKQQALGLQPTDNQTKAIPVKGAKRPGESAGDFLDRQKRSK